MTKGKTNLLRTQRFVGLVVTVDSVEGDEGIKAASCTAPFRSHVLTVLEQGYDKCVQCAVESQQKHTPHQGATKATPTVRYIAEREKKRREVRSLRYEVSSKCTFCFIMLLNCFGFIY
jgi:hypothetical protein